MATSRVIEASTLVPTKDGSVQSYQPATKADAAKYFRDTKPGAAKKESVIDTLEQQMKAVEDLKSAGDYKLVPKDDTDAKDPLEHLTGGYEVVFTPAAKKAWTEVISSLDDNLSSSNPKSKALVYKPESSKILATLFELISLKSSDGDEYLAPVQRKARELLESAITNGGSIAGIDPYSRDCVLRMLSANKSEAIRGSIDLIRAEGLDKLAKKDSGFIGKLSRSNGKLGKALGEFVFNNIKALTSRPLDMTADSNIDEAVRSEIQSLKTDLFETTFQKIHEEFDKKKAQMKDLKTEDQSFISDFEDRARAVFTAQEADAAETASHQLTELIVGKVARVQDAAAAIQTATDLKIALGSNPKQPKPISIPKEVITGLKNNAALKQDWYNQVAADAQTTILSTPTSPASINLTQKQIQARFQQMLTKAGKDSASLNDFIPLTDPAHPGTTTPHPLRAAPIALNVKEIESLIAAVDDTGTYSAKAWPATSTIPASHAHNLVFNAIVDKIKEEIVSENTKKLAKATAIDTVDSSTLTTDEKIEKVLNGDVATNPALTGEASWNFVLDTTNPASKTAAADIKSQIEDYKKTKEADKKYYERFTNDMNKYVFSPIMTRAGTINETIRYALENSMIMEDGTLREEFKDSFNSLTDSAKQAITDKVMQVRNDLDAMKATTIGQVTTALNSMLTGLGVTGGYAGFVTGLGHANEDVALTNLSEALTASGSPLGTKDKEILDASQDSYLSAFDLAKRQVERVNLIATKLLDLQTKHTKGAIAKISDPTKRAVVTGFMGACTILGTGLSKGSVDSVKTKYDGVRANFFAKIDKLEAESKSLEDIETKANGDIWELLTDNDTEKGPVKGILASLTQGLQDGLAALMRSLGLYNASNVVNLKTRVEAIDQGSENKGFLEPLQLALTSISNKFPANKAADSSAESKPTT